MFEQSKSTRRRAERDSRYMQRWFVGRGLDVGCGPDPLARESYPRVTEVIPYDIVLGSGNAQLLPEIKDEEFDFLHASHCLEHLVHPYVALRNWLRVLRPGGYIICTVPEELLFEQGRWPSTFSGADHKHSFTLRSMPLIPWSINVMALLARMNVDVEHLSLITQGWEPEKLGIDQTRGEAECCIEFVARKPDAHKPW